MKHIKNRKDFLFENVTNIDWDKVEKFVAIVSKDYQLVDTDDEFSGFLNIDPSDIKPGIDHWSYVHEFMKAMERDDANYAKALDLLDKYNLMIKETPDEEELIIYEKESVYRDMDPEEYLKSRGAYKTEDGWNCNFIIHGEDRRTPLVKNGKFTVQFNRVKGMNFNMCNLKSLEGVARFCDGDISLSTGNYIPNIVVQWYVHTIQMNDGYEDYWNDLLNFVLKKDVKQISSIEWPEGFLDANLKKTTDVMKKFDL